MAFSSNLEVLAIPKIQFLQDNQDPSSANHSNLDDSNIIFERPSSSSNTTPPTREVGLGDATITKTCLEEVSRCLFQKEDMRRTSKAMLMLSANWPLGDGPGRGQFLWKNGQLNGSRALPNRPFLEIGPIPYIPLKARGRAARLPPKWQKPSTGTRPRTASAR